VYKDSGTDHLYFRSLIKRRDQEDLGDLVQKENIVPSPLKADNPVLFAVLGQG
ncbi:hypothetical protein J6590_104162, partial [Homalodisca vitripennis]